MRDERSRLFEQPQRPDDLGSLMRLRVTAEADPGVLTQILGEFRNQNIQLRRVTAEFGIHDQLFLEVDVFGLQAARLTLIAAKIARAVHVLNAYWQAL